MEEKQRVILILNIKIDSTHSDDLIVRENDEPEELASEFCTKHSLEEHVRVVLVKHIEENLDAFIEEELENSATNISSLLEPQGKPINTSMQSNHRRTESAKNYGEFLYDKGILMKQKVEHMVQAQKQNLLEKEMKNSTFTPKINKYFLKTRNFSDMHQRKKNFRLNETQNSNPCTFKPKINRNRSNSREPKEKKIDRCVELYNNAQIIKKKLAEKGKKM